MTLPLPDDRLRDDVAQQIFTQRLGQKTSTSLGELRSAFDDLARASFEAAEAFVQARKNADQKRRSW